MAIRRRSDIRVAVVGAGLMGRWHAHNAERAGARVLAVVDRDARRAEELSGRFPGARAVQDLRDVVDLVDVVQICTPTPTHVSLTTDALEAGRHVLVEKPLAPTAAAVASLLDLAARRNVLLCPVHQFPFQDGVQRAIARLAAIGPLRHVSFATCSAGADGGGRDPEQVAREILPHPLSLLVRLVPRVQDIDWAVRHPSAGEIRALGQIGELTASILISMSGRPTINILELIGEHGTTSVDLFHGFAVTHGGRVSRLRKAARPFATGAVTTGMAASNLLRRAWRREPAYPGLRALFEAFYVAVKGEAPCPIAPAEVLAVAAETDRLAQLLGIDGKRAEGGRRA